MLVTVAKIADALENVTENAAVVVAKIVMDAEVDVTVVAAEDALHVMALKRHLTTELLEELPQS
jgi:predicted transcriptional regulator